MKYLLLLSLYFAQTFAFSPRRPDHHRYFTAIVTTTPSTLLLLRSSPEEKTENPCWQDVYDDDCSMNNIAAAGFVASKWIKGMPCAAGIEDCDMPEKLQTPAEYRDGGVDDVDVMDFLGLKRAESLKAHHDTDTK